jgi:rhodanese-related sulfurtransferase
MNCYESYYQSVSPSEGRKLLKRNRDILLIDVRSPEEYTAGHIPGSVNIPIEVLEWELFNLQLSPYTPIMVYCKSGIRATSAACILISLGFINVYNLGGIQRWPYKIVQ